MYRSETEKIRPKALHYISGKVLDIGCGHDKILPTAVGVDVRALDGIDVVTTQFEKLSEILPHDFDSVYSSHCLEHIFDDVGALTDWGKLLKPDGTIFLYLPDIRYYREYNPEHAHNYSYDSFMHNIPRLVSNLKLVESGMDVGDQRYSFWVVLKKI